MYKSDGKTPPKLEDASAAAIAFNQMPLEELGDEIYFYLSDDFDDILKIKYLVLIY